MTERVMLDIETLGTDPGCVVLSIGAVRFSEAGIDAQLHESVSRESCERANLVVDEETLAWWQDQSEQARAVLTGGDELEIVLTKLHSFYEGAEEVWAKSPAFDVAILDAAYDAVGQDSPWKFWQTRDVRTIEALPVDVETQHEGVTHDALDDAMYQTKVVLDTLNSL